MPYIRNIMPNRSPRPDRKKARLPEREPVVAVLAYDGVNVFELGLAVEVFGLTV